MTAGQGPGGAENFRVGTRAPEAHFVTIVITL